MFMIKRFKKRFKIKVFYLHLVAFFSYVRYMLSPVRRLSSVCLSSVTFVHPTQPVEIFGNFSSPFVTLAIH